MKLKFKTQAYQTAAVQAVVDCFKGQPSATTEAIMLKSELAAELAHHFTGVEGGDA